MEWFDENEFLFNAIQNNYVCFDRVSDCICVYSFFNAVSWVGTREWKRPWFCHDPNLSDHIIRKIAHFTEYTVLGALLCSCAYSFARIKPIKFVPYTVSIGLFTCFVDETIQLGIEGRSGQVSDMWIDFFGVLLGTAVMLVAFWIYRKIRKIN